MSEKAILDWFLVISLPAPDFQFCFWIRKCLLHVKHLWFTEICWWRIDVPVSLLVLYQALRKWLGGWELIYYIVTSLCERLHHEGKFNWGHSPTISQMSEGSSGAWAIIAKSSIWLLSCNIPCLHHKSHKRFERGKKWIKAIARSKASSISWIRHWYHKFPEQLSRQKVSSQSDGISQGLRPKVTHLSAALIGKGVESKSAVVTMFETHGRIGQMWAWSGHFSLSLKKKDKYMWIKCIFARRKGEDCAKDWLWQCFPWRIEHGLKFRATVSLMIQGWELHTWYANILARSTRDGTCEGSTTRARSIIAWAWAAFPCSCLREENSKSVGTWLSLTDSALRNTAAALLH